MHRSVESIPHIGSAVVERESPSNEEEIVNRNTNSSSSRSMLLTRSTSIATSSEVGVSPIKRHAKPSSLASPPPRCTERESCSM
jgi:hypothetical protein